MNVTIGDKKTYDDWGLLLKEIYIAPPEVKSCVVDVPGRDGSLDLSEALTGDVNFQNRSIRLVFDAPCSLEEWHSLISRISNAIHGKKNRIILDTDKSYFYIGRLSIDSEKTGALLCSVEMTGDVEPYKYDLTDGLEEWLWDDFSFLDGIIREYREITVPGSVFIGGRRKKTIPVFLCSNDMTATYGGVDYPLKAGENTVYEIRLGEGLHELAFSGSGTVSVSYRGGSL